MLLPRLLDALPAGRVREKVRLILLRRTAARGGWAITRDELGNDFLVDRSHFLGAYLSVSGQYERPTLAFMRGLASQADQFIDIGANFGIYTVPMSKLLATTAYEADPANLQHLRVNLWLNAVNPTVRDVALSNVPGSATFFLSRGTAAGDFGVSNPGTSSLVAHATHHADQPTVVVQTVRLDDDFRSVKGQRLLFKIDVEGHELAVVEGMAETLRDNDCLVVAEVFADHRERWEQLLTGMGYEETSGELDVHYVAYAKAASTFRA